jgi:hypothetical protein
MNKVLFAAATSASILLSHLPAYARGVLLYCTVTPSGMSVSISDVMEVDFDKSTVRERIQYPTAQEYPAEISLQWIKWSSPGHRAEIDRFTGEYHRYVYDSFSKYFKGHCAMSDGPAIRP